MRWRPRYSLRRYAYRVWPKARWIVLAFVVAVVVFGPTRPRAPESLSEGLHRVERAVDGDTLLLANGARVRLQGIDTPETKHPHRAPEPFGREAAEFTTRLVEGKQVRLELDVHRLDRYGRFLAYVYVEDLFLNEELVRRGLARARPEFQYRADMKRRFLAAQRSAQQQRLGIWSRPEPGRSQDKLDEAQ